MAFEQNQQDAFNLRNDTERMKQFEAELDKATASIGAAEVAAEKELAELKLKNLATQQESRIKKLDELIEREEAGIRKLAALRRELSDKQFEARKKEIQKELQLLEEAIDELRGVKVKKSEDSATKQTSNTVDTTSVSKAKQMAPSGKTSIKDSGKVADPELIKLVSSIDKTLGSLRDSVTKQGQPKEKNISVNDGTEQQTSTTKDIQNATAAVQQTETQTQNINNTSSSTKVDAGTTDVTSEEKPTPVKREFSNDAALLDLVDLGHYSFEAVSSSFDALKNSLEDSMDAGVKSVLNQATDNKSAISQGTIDLAGDLLVSFKKAEAAEEKLRALRADADADEATRKAVALNNEILFETALQQRREAFAAKERELIEQRAQAEADIAWNADHRRELLDQEEQNERLKYLAEYQQLQTDGFNHLTENISLAVFEALREREDKIEKAAAAQHKASMAGEKALDTLRRKDLTNKQKKELLEAQVQKRAAEKDWSNAGKKFQITDDMDDAEKAEVQKRRENAVKAEMAVNAAMSAMANFAQQLNKQTDKIGEKQAPIDTRLQGSLSNDTMVGSYWKRLAKDMNYIGAVNPYFTQEDFASNIETLVNKGISFDIKQRAFLMTIQEKIANTFDAADGTLLRLVRIQQQDTTAGRLGMESALNSFLNSMYETSEYLSDVASSVRSSLEEMQALMEGATGTELEFQVQKWMGSLYSVGMSQDAVQNIAQTFGQIASGDVSGLTGNGTGNLLIMAANEAGLSIADILQEGLDAKETNELMQAMVNYLAEIAETSSDSRVVQQQLANVYGIKASDLRAATNLASSIKEVSNQDLTYGGMLGQLQKMANSMLLRTSTGEMLSNVWGNVQYTMATTMANDPLMYLLPRLATLLEDYAGGIDLPFLNVMGFGVDLNTSVAQLMNVAALSGSILGSLGPMITGLASAVSGSAMLSLAGINTSGKAPVIARGSAQPLQNLGGTSTSESGYVGNSSGEDVKNATLQDAEDDKKKQMVEAKEEESSDDVVIKAQLAAISIYNLLEEVAHGSQSLRVRVVSGGCSCGSHGNGYGSVGGNSQDPLNGGGDVATSPGAGNGGTDNGNWVLSF